jgi:hypothetical protein
MQLERNRCPHGLCRFMHKPFVTSKQLAGDICSGLVPAALVANEAAAAAMSAGADGDAGGPVASALSPRAGLMFGRESSGLTNEEVALANKVIRCGLQGMRPRGPDAVQSRRDPAACSCCAGLGCSSCHHLNRCCPQSPSVAAQPHPVLCYTVQVLTIEANPVYPVLNLAQVRLGSGVRCGACSVSTVDYYY